MCWADSATEAFAVIGSPVEHSISPQIHNTSFEALGLNCVYLAHRVEGDSLAGAMGGLRALGYTGVNITLPHKVEVIKHLDELSREARVIGAVNTVKFEGGRARGHNTDGRGALSALEEAGVELEHKRVLILGYGGAARAISTTLALEGKVDRITIGGRSMRRAKALARDLAGLSAMAEAKSMEDIQGALRESDILVHATPVGMSPRSDESLLGSEQLHAGLTVMDIVYSPLETKLLQEAKRAGCRTVDGLAMLIHQAVGAEKIWLGREFEPPVARMRQAALEALGL